MEATAVDDRIEDLAGRMAAFEAVHGRIKQEVYYLRGGPRRAADFECPMGYHLGPCGGCGEPMQINTEVDSAERKRAQIPYRTKDGAFAVDVYAGMRCASGCYDLYAGRGSQYVTERPAENMDPETRMNTAITDSERGFDDSQRRSTPDFTQRKRGRP
jgi:hypothetical protein